MHYFRRHEELVQLRHQYIDQNRKEKINNGQITLMSEKEEWLILMKNFDNSMTHYN